MTAVPPKNEPFVADLNTVKQDSRAREYKEFLKYVAERTGVASYEQLSILFPALCQSAMEWLLVEKKTVDFGFVMLHPRPHRANWCSMLVALFPSLGPTLLGKPRLIKEALLTSSGFNTKLFSGELLAIASERYVAWGIETEVKRSWWKAMFRHETSKLSALGSVSYAAYTAQQILKLRPRLTNAYLSFLRQISYPCAKIQQSRIYGRGFIVPFVPKGRIRPMAVEDVPVHAVVPRDPQDIPTPSLKDVAIPDAVLPQVSDIQQPTPDLRLPGRTHKG